MTVSQDDVLIALRRVQDPELFKDLVTLNRIKNIKVAGSAVSVEAEFPQAATRDVLKQAIEAAVLQVPGVEEVFVSATSSLNTIGKPPAGPQRPQEKKPILPGVQHVIAVGAGKGGVGKSTVAVNLAVGLTLQGYKVGLLDGDMYGPSVPTLVGLEPGNPRVENGMILPYIVGPSEHPLAVMSIGFMVEKEKALIWRGPMAQGALKQFMTDWNWGTLDYLIVDLPPGTGDISLTLAQSVPLTGAVVIATPQEVALMDARRAVRMFQQLGVEILGVVENMSSFTCNHGETYDIFGRGGAQLMAQQMGLPFLGDLPISMALRENSDSGKPWDNFADGAASAAALKSITRMMVSQVQVRQTTKPAAKAINLSIS